jgi:hypothetical protein
MSKTDQFDMALELTQEALGRVVASQHAVGVLKHAYAEMFSGQRIDLLVNAPQPVLQVSGGAFITRLNTRVFYNGRDPSRPEDLGDSAVADVAVRATIALAGANPTLIDASPQLRIDWNGTTAADINVHTANAALRTRVESALLRSLGTTGANSFALPPIGPADERIGAIGFRFMTGGGGAPILIVGMNVGPVLRGNPSGISERFVSRDWALALSGSYFLGRLRAQLNETMPLPRRVASKCTISAPFVGCVNTSTVNLTSLGVELRNGFILISGHLNVLNSGVAVPDISASFSAHVTLGVTSAGTISANVNSVTVDTSLFGEVIDFFTGDAFTDQISNAVTNALESGTSGNATEFFKASTINSLAGGYGPRPVDLRPKLSLVAIVNDAVVLHGVLETPQAEHDPEPAFVAIELGRPDATHRRFLFNSHASWAPGSTIAKYDWRYSDGQSETFADTNCRFLTIHDFPILPSDPIDIMIGRTLAGWACLKITDIAGRSAEICATQFESVQTIVTVCVAYEWIPQEFRASTPRSPRAPLSDVVMRGAFVRQPNEKLEDLPLIAAEDPAMAFRRRFDLRPDDPTHYGFGIDPITKEQHGDRFEIGTHVRREFDLGPLGPPEPPDLDLLFPDVFDRFFIPICIFSKQVRGSQARMELELSNGEVLGGETDKGGHAGFVVSKAQLSLKQVDEDIAGLARARFVVRLVDRDVNARRTLWFALAKERQELVASLKNAVLQRNERFLEALGGRDFFISGQYRRAPLTKQMSISRTANAVDRLLNVSKLLAAGSAMTPIQRLLGLPRSSAPIEIAINIRALFATIDEQIETLSKS